MVLSCKHVWREISNYIEGALDPKLREEIEKHLAHCRHCAAVLDSTRNILVLVADERTFELPLGYSKRLHNKLSEMIASTAPGSK
jgi:anti-sigma factor RsiW